jgi:hypothetical protein
MDRIALIQKKGTVLKIDTPNIISKYDKTIYDVHAMEYPSIDSGFKEYPSQYSVYALGEYIHYSDAKMICTNRTRKLPKERNQQ